MANSVYDPEEEQASGGTGQSGSSFEPHTIHKNPAEPSEGDGSRGNLKNAEEAGGGTGSSGTGSSGSFNFNPGGDTGSVAGAGLAAGEKMAGLASGFGGGAVAATTLAAGAKNLFWGSKNRKRATVGGGITGTLVGGGAFMLVLLSGPAQLVQLSQVLQRDFSGMNSTSSSRAIKILNSAGAQDLGETRVGTIQRQYLRSTLTNLSEIGVDLHPNGVGGFDSGTIDAKKLSYKYSDLGSMSPEEQKAWLANKMSIPEDKISVHGGTYSINGADFSIGDTRALLGNVSDLSDNGPVLSAANKRILATYFGAYSIFHPFSRLLQDKLNNAASAADERSVVEEDRQALAEPTEIQADPAEEDTKSNASTYDSFATKALTYTSGVCFVRSTANDLITINRFRVALPAAIAALQLISMGSQIQSGQDVSMKEVGAVTDSLTGADGQSIWQGQALQVTAGTPHPSGPDIPADYQQAFSSKTTAANIVSAADSSIPGGSTVANQACSPLGQAAQAGISLIQAAATAAADAETAGTATGPLFWATFATHFGENAALQAVSMHFLQQFILSQAATGTLAKDAFSGPLGGNLLAYGAREAANVGAIAEGGVALTGTETTTLATQQQRQDQQQFRSENFFARTFDIYDYRSLAGRLADSIRPGYTANVASAVTGFQNLGGNLFGNLSSIFLPRSQADNQYHWTFPEYNIPGKLLKDPGLSNIPAYQKQLTSVLDSQCLNSDGTTNSDCGYISKAFTCFGNKVNKDSGVWDIQHDHDPNTQDPDYIAANCNDLSDPTWNEMIMFNADTYTADAMACFKFNDDQACQAIGFSQASTSSAPATPTTGGFTNPFPDGWTPGRLDMGYDGFFKNQIVSPCDGNMVYVNDDSSQGDNGGWEGAFIAVQCSQTIPGLPSNIFYFAEGIKPTVTQGQTVTAGQQIAVPGWTGYSEGPGGIEWGLADPSNPATVTLAESGVNGMTNCSAASASMVLAFSKWVQQNLGVKPPAETDHAGCA